MERVKLKSCHRITFDANIKSFGYNLQIESRLSLLIIILFIMIVKFYYFISYLEVYPNSLILENNLRSVL